MLHQRLQGLDQLLQGLHQPTEFFLGGMSFFFEDFAKKVVHPKCIQSILIQSILIIIFNYVARLVQASSSKGGVLKAAHAGKRSTVMQSVKNRFWTF